MWALALPCLLSSFWLAMEAESTRAELAPPRGRHRCGLRARRGRVPPRRRPSRRAQRAPRTPPALLKKLRPASTQHRNHRHGPRRRDAPPGSGARLPPRPPPRRPARAPGGPGPHSRLPRGARGQLGCESEGRWRNGGRAGAGGGGERPRRLRCRSTYRSTSPPYFAAVSLPQDLPQYFAAVLRRSLCLCFCRSNSLLYFAAIFCQSTCCSTSRRAGAGWGVRWGGGVTGGLAPVVASTW